MSHSSRSPPPTRLSVYIFERRNDWTTQPADDDDSRSYNSLPQAEHIENGPILRVACQVDGDVIGRSNTAVIQNASRDKALCVGDGPLRLEGGNSKLQWFPRSDRYDTVCWFER